MPKLVSYERDLITNVFGRFIQQLPLVHDSVEAWGAHNGVALITEQQEPQQCEELDTNSKYTSVQLMLASITDDH